MARKLQVHRQSSVGDFQMITGVKDLWLWDGVG